MKKLFFILFLIGINVYSQEYIIKKGGVTDSLPIPGSKENSYAIYLPLDYSAEKEWPLIFVFDPEGRGRITANLFKTAAEKQHYIIAAANINLKSEPLDSIVADATAMMHGVFSTFPINGDMVYSAGMGEGAQVASALPFFYTKLSGIMAIGNSFVNPKYLDRENPYMFIGVSGKKDYMVYQMEDFVRFYDNLDFPTDIYYFDGKENEWPEERVISNAVTGFTLQAIKKELRTKDQNFIQQLYNSEIEYTESLRRTRNYYAAYEKLERMEAKYKDLGFDDDLKERMKTIKDADAFRSQRREFREATALEKPQQDEYDYLLDNDIVTANFDNIGWWAYQVDELQKLKESSNNAKANMAYRLHGYLDFVTKREFNDIMKSQAGIDYKIFIAVLRTVIKKNDPEAYLKIISLAGADGDYETALLYLEDLLKTGYSDIESLYNIDGVLDLQFTREYNDIIKKYLGTSKFYQKEGEELKD